MTVLTYNNKQYITDFSRKATLIEAYKTNMITYLKTMFPDRSDDQLDDIISDKMKTSYVRTDIQYLSQPEPGNVKVVDGTLLDFTNDLGNVIITPSGATYLPINVRRSMFYDHISSKQAERKVVKKNMLLAEAANDHDRAIIEFLSQTNIKMGINQISGVMLSSVSFRSSINYNSITATARFNTMLAYSVVERVLESNYYFSSESSAINWIVNLIRIYPGDERFSRCISRYKISIPSVEHIKSEFTKQVRIYSQFCDPQLMYKLIDNLTDNQRAFVYYAQDLRRIFMENESFRKYLDKTFDMDNIPMITGPIPSISKLPDDIIITMVVVMLADDIGSIPRDSIDVDHPELAAKIYSVYKWMEDRFEMLSELFDNLILVPIVPGDIINHKNMLRRAVLVSDTDSILFTTISWIKWYTGDIRINDRSTRMNTFIVAIIFKIMIHAFAYTGVSMNVAEDNVKTVALKNEFMYDVFLRTTMSKHYAGYAKYREGVRMIPYKFDIKGKNFIGSDLCKTTTSFVKEFIKGIFDEFLIDYQLDPISLITKIITFEQTIRKSVLEGEVEFLAQAPVKLRSEYKNPESSNFIHYELWMEVFSGEYPAIYPPQKCKVLPVYPLSAKTDNTSIIKKSNPAMYNRLISFIQKYPKREFNRILIPMDIRIPSELREITDYRRICASNCFSLYLIMKSINVVINPSDDGKILFSDVYPSICKEVCDVRDIRS